jgi:hypothetical protein
MNHKTFQEQFDRELAPFTQTIASTHAARQHQHFGQLCEQFRLYALAAHNFRRLAQLDPANRAQHGSRFLHNFRKASSRAGECSAIYN